MIWEILPYIRARSAFKLGHAQFPTSIICLNTTLYQLPIVTKVAFPTFTLLWMPLFPEVAGSLIRRLPGAPVFSSFIRPPAVGGTGLLI